MLVAGDGVCSIVLAAVEVEEETRVAFEGSQCCKDTYEDLHLDRHAASRMHL